MTYMHKLKTTNPIKPIKINFKNTTIKTIAQAQHVIIYTINPKILILYAN